MLSRAGASSLARILTTLCLLAANAIAYRAMTHAEFGLWVMLLQIFFLATNFDMGFRSSMSNRLAALSAKGSAAEAERRDTFLTALYVVGAVALAGGGLLLLLGRWISPEQFFRLNDSGLVARAHRLLPVVWVLFAAMLPWSMCGGIFGAYDEIELGSLFVAALAVFMTAALALAALLKHSFAWMVLSYFGANTGGYFLMTLFFMSRRGWSPRPPPLAKMRSIAGSLLAQSLEFFGFNLSTTIQLVVSTLMAGYTSGAAAAGAFYVVNRIFSSLTTMNLAILIPVGPLVTRHASAGDWDDVRRRLRKCLLLLWPLLFPVAGGIFFLVHPLLLRVWLGNWMSDYVLAGLLLAWACCQGFGDTISVFLNSLGLIRVQAALVYIMLLPSILLPAWLGHLWGPRGVAAAGVLCMLPAMVMLPLYARIVFRHKLMRV